MAVFNDVLNTTGQTFPTITITSVNAVGGLSGSPNRGTGRSNLSLQFQYLPESVSFGVSAALEAHPIPMTAAQFLQYSNSKIDDISVNIKVAAGCQGALVTYSSNTSTSGFSALSGGTTIRTRADLMSIAKFMYSLPLPGSASSGYPTLNDQTGTSSTTGATNGYPPGVFNLIIGPYCGCTGAFSAVNITFNGPYDYDGSPTDMDISFTFMPSEFWVQAAALDENPSLTNFQSRTTMTSDAEVSGLAPGKLPYAIWVGVQQANAGGVQSIPDKPSTPSTTAPSTVPAFPEQSGGPIPTPGRRS